VGKHLGGLGLAQVLLNQNALGMALQQHEQAWLGGKTDVGRAMVEDDLNRLVDNHILANAQEGAILQPAAVEQGEGVQLALDQATQVLADQFTLVGVCLAKGNQLERQSIQLGALTVQHAVVKYQAIAIE